MLRKLLVAAMAAALSVGVAWGGSPYDVPTDTVPDTINEDTFIYTTGSTPVVDGTKSIVINDTFTLTIGPNASPATAGTKLEYTLNSIASNGATAGLTIASANGNLGTTVTMKSLDFSKGGTVTIANGVAGAGNENRLILDTFTAGTAAAGVTPGVPTTFNIGDYAAFQVKTSATFTGGTINGAGTFVAGSSLITTGANNKILLDDKAQLIFDGGFVNASAHTLYIDNTTADGMGTVVFTGVNGLRGTIYASNVNTVINGTGSESVIDSSGGSFTYTTASWEQNGGYVMRANSTVNVRGDANINAGMIRVRNLNVDGTYSIKANAMGHATNVNANKMAPIVAGAVDMIMNGHTLATGGYTIEGDAFVKACRMADTDSKITFTEAGNSFTVKQYGILSVLENNLVINGTDSTFDVGGYFLTDHNAQDGQKEGFCQVSEMSNAVIRDTAALVLGERQQYFYNAGLEAITTGDTLILTAVGGTITGMFNNVHEQANGWGYYSYFGDFDLEVKQTPLFGEALGITKFTRSDYKDFSQNRAQLAKMGLNPNTAGIGMLQNLQNVAMDLADFAGGKAKVADSTGNDNIYKLQSSEVMEYGPSYDAGGNKGYEIGRMRLPGNNDVENYGYVAGRLNRDMLSSVVNGSRVFQTDRRNVKDSNYIGFINGTMDRALWEYVNAATITNVVRANQRAALAAADMVYDRLHRYQRTTTDLCAAFGSDTGMAAAILNQHYLNRFWVQGIGQWDEMDERDGFAGYDYDAYGFAVGYDRALGPVILGGSFAYTAGDYEDKWATSHDSDIDNYAFNLYATYSHRSGFFGTLVGGYTYSDNDINETRGNNRASQDFETNTWYVSGKLGYDWRPTSAFTLTPSVGLGYVHSRSKDHDGVYAGISHMRFSRATADTGFIPVELRANYDWVINECSAFSLNAKVGYTYNFDEDGATGTARLYELPGANPIRAVDRELGHHAWNLGVGVNYSYKRFDFGVNYDYVGMSDFDSHRVTASVGIGF